MALTSTYTARGSFPGRRRPPCVRRHWGLVHGPGRKNHARGRWERLRRPSAGLGASDLAFQDVCSMSSSPSSPGSDSGPVSWTPRASVVRLLRRQPARRCSGRRTSAGRRRRTRGLGEWNQRPAVASSVHLSMIIRWISLVPSKIVKIVDERSVSAGQRRVWGCGISTDPAPDFGGRRRFPAAPHMLPSTGGSPRKAPQTPGISCRQSIARRYLGGTFSLTCQGTPPVRQWRTGGLHTGPTPRNAHGTLLAAVVPTRRRHGPDRPYHANGGKPAAVMSAAPWCPARGHYMEDVRVISRTRPGVTALAI